MRKLYLLKRRIARNVKNLLSPPSISWRCETISWEKVESKCFGYSSEEILATVHSNALLAKKGLAKYERDGKIFYDEQYDFILLYSLTLSTSSLDGVLNLIDYGGSLGSSYYQNRPLLEKNFRIINWNIVEQDSFVRIGVQDFQDTKLKFYKSISGIKDINSSWTFLISSTLQYLSKPYDLLEEVRERKLRYVLILRTPFIHEDSDIVTSQIIRRQNGYSGSYPCWLISLAKFKKFIAGSYTVIFQSVRTEAYTTDHKRILFYDILLELI